MDMILASTNYTLGANVENLTLTSTAVIGCGNDQSNSLSGNSLSNNLNGGQGNDLLNGNVGNDTLVGCFNGKDGGKNEVDTLIGGLGADLFQLGYSNGRFYDDGIVSTFGRSDYLLISDFTIGQDKLQLDGNSNGYYLASSGVSGVTGQGLFSEQGATDELLAIIRSSNNTALTAENTIKTALFI